MVSFPNGNIFCLAEKEVNGILRKPAVEEFF
jgi:hypothetical protein